MLIICPEKEGYKGDFKVYSDSLEKQSCMISDISGGPFYRNWLTWLWRLRSSMADRLQAGEPGRLMVQFRLNLKPESQER